MAAKFIAALIVIALAGKIHAESGSESKLVIPACSVYAIDKTDVPARDDGVLTELYFLVGMEVDQGAIVAKIDDTAARLAVEIAKASFAVAEKEAQNEADIEFARISQKLAKAEYDRAKAAQDAVAAGDLDKLFFAWEKAALQSRQAEHAREQNILKGKAQQAELRMAEEAVQRRVICAPFQGEILKADRHIGEWLRAGDKVFTIVRLSQLRVQTQVSAEQWSQEEIRGRRGVFTAKLAKGRQETFQGVVSYVGPGLDDVGRFDVWFDVENRQSEGRWLLPPGASGTLTIDVRSETSPPSPTVNTPLVP